MTTKPEDIPQDVWDKAAAAMEAMDVYPIDIRQDTVARAILAAKAEEREECALEADKATRFNRGIAAQRACYRIADAIRKRGEG